MGIERKQVDWIDPVGIQFRNIKLKSVEDYTSFVEGVAIADGRFLGSTSNERTELQDALEAGCINANVTPPVRQLSGNGIFNSDSSSPSTTVANARGILCRELSGDPSGGEDLQDVWLQVAGPGGVEDYTVNRVRVRDAVTHDPIDDGSGNEIWGILGRRTTFTDTEEIVLFFFSGDPQYAVNQPFDITTTTWYQNDTGTGTNNVPASLEIILNESVEYRDIPYGHNLRDVVNFFDVAQNIGNLPLTVYTDYASATVNAASETVDTSGAGTTFDVADGTLYRVGERIWLDDNGGSTQLVHITNIATNTLTVDATITAVSATATVYHDNEIYTVTDTSFIAETTAGERTTIEAYVNGTKYIVSRPSAPLGAANDLDDESIDSDFYASAVTGNVPSGTLEIWWLSLGWANASARFDLESGDEVYFTIHSK